MTEKEIQFQIQEQIKALKTATTNATKSKEAANEYLVEAGIISKEKESNFEENKVIAPSPSFSGNRLS